MRRGIESIRVVSALENDHRLVTDRVERRSERIFEDAGAKQVRTMERLIRARCLRDERRKRRIYKQQRQQTFANHSREEWRRVSIRLRRPILANGEAGERGHERGGARDT